MSTRESGGAPNASDDGAFGDTVAAWCEGVSSVTKRPCTRPRSAALRAFLDCLQSHGPKEGPQAKVEWSRQKGAEFAKTTPPGVDAFAFARWLNGAEQDRASGVRKTVSARFVQEDSGGEKVWEEGEVVGGK